MKRVPRVIMAKGARFDPRVPHNICRSSDSDTLTNEGRI
jgi:hypothetical protein